MRAYGKISKEFWIGNSVRQSYVFVPIFYPVVYAVINIFLQKDPGNGIAILFSTKAKPVGNRKQMIDQT